MRNPSSLPAFMPTGSPPDEESPVLFTWPSLTLRKTLRLRCAGRLSLMASTAALRTCAVNILADGTPSVEIVLSAVTCPADLTRLTSRELKHAPRS